MTYRVVQTVPSGLVNPSTGKEIQELVSTEFDTFENLVAGLEVRGYTFKELETSERLREELRGEPKFNGLLGPMYDGPGVVRYETQQAYNILSTCMRAELERAVLAWSASIVRIP